MQHKRRYWSESWPTLSSSQQAADCSALRMCVNSCQLCNKQTQARHTSSWSNSATVPELCEALLLAAAHALPLQMPCRVWLVQSRLESCSAHRRLSAQNQAAGAGAAAAARAPCLLARLHAAKHTACSAWLVSELLSGVGRKHCEASWMLLRSRRLDEPRPCVQQQRQQQQQQGHACCIEQVNRVQRAGGAQAVLTPARPGLVVVDLF